MKKLLVLLPLMLAWPVLIQVYAQEKINPEATEVWEPVPPVINSW